MNIIIKEAFVTLATLNIEGLTEFYTKLFSTNPTQRISGKYTEFVINSLRLGIFTPKLAHHHEFANPHQSPISLCVVVEDLDTAIAHFEQMEYALNFSINIASHGREIYVYDPDGNRVIFYQPFAL